MSWVQHLKLAIKKKLQEIGEDLQELTEAKKSVIDALKAVGKYGGDI